MHLNQDLNLMFGVNKFDARKNNIMTKSILKIL